ncbi:MAG: hypothetical protein KIT69_11070, partial [Propionibacteriaceae bacterium]|nr:hypothetical protein [Propionibacteriaceae bacterium]
MWKTLPRVHSVDYGGHQDDVGSMGAPIPDESESVIAAISVSVPRVRFPQSRC